MGIHRNIPYEFAIPLPRWDVAIRFLPSPLKVFDTPPLGGRKNMFTSTIIIVGHGYMNACVIYKTYCYYIIYTPYFKVWVNY